MTTEAVAATAQAIIAGVALWLAWKANQHQAASVKATYRATYVAHLLEALTDLVEDAEVARETALATIAETATPRTPERAAELLSSFNASLEPIEKRLRTLAILHSDLARPSDCWRAIVQDESIASTFGATERADFAKASDTRSRFQRLYEDFLATLKLEH